jgi:hypothetical protein
MDYSDLRVVHDHFASDREEGHTENDRDCVRAKKAA